MIWLLTAVSILAAPQENPVPQSPIALVAAADALSCNSHDNVCLSQEFALRGQADQSVRGVGIELICPRDDQPCINEAWHRINCENLARLVAVVDARGWPPLTGDAAMGAWLIVQHADATPETDSAAFRDRMLPMILKEVEAGRLAPDTYTRMADRSALARGELQPFGSIRTCREGEFDRTTVSSIKDADQRRRDVGMDILLSESLRLFDSLCARDAQQSGG